LSVDSIPAVHELTQRFRVRRRSRLLDEVQAAPIDKLPVNERWTTVPADVGDVRVRIVRPADAVGTLPVILYMHGGGWMLGNAAGRRARGSGPRGTERRCLELTRWSR
jgi:acetyl esterase/lipase